MKSLIGITDPDSSNMADCTRNGSQHGAGRDILLIQAEKCSGGIGMGNLNNPCVSRLAGANHKYRYCADLFSGLTDARLQVRGDSLQLSPRGIKTLNGKPVSPGCARGCAVILDDDRSEISKTNVHTDQIDTELARFHAALEYSHRDLAQLQARVRFEIGSGEHAPGTADIFSAHLLLLEDPQFIDSVEAYIQSNRLVAEMAVKLTSNQLACSLKDADSLYLHERASDVLDIQRRLLQHLTRTGAACPERLEPGSILVARELLPSKLLELNREQLKGIITETGGETTHTAILARAFGIPAVTGVIDATRTIKPDTQILIDGLTGKVVLGAGSQRHNASNTCTEKAAWPCQPAVITEERECKTRDGIKIQLYANIGYPHEADQVAEYHLDGVGLFRTEYLFLTDPVAPSFECQREIYCRVAATLNGRPLVIRTLDLGGDKWPAFLEPRSETNPSLGVRGLRFSLHDSVHLFRTQIRAALHAAIDHNVRIMLPMVLGNADLLHAFSIIRKVAEDEGITELPSIGTLVETPSAVFSIEEILAASDFICIGTNDLTQYILAADRNSLAMTDENTVLHPSVLRAVCRILEAANAAGKPVTVCGEAASNPHAACLLVGLGARALSMNPMSAACVRDALHESYQNELEALSQTALNCDSARTVSLLLAEALHGARPAFCSYAKAV